MKIYSFFRSGSSHRLRIALNLKGLQAQYMPIDLRTEEHLGDQFREVNPQQLVPALEFGGKVMIQSPAIVEWLEETHPSPALLPSQSEDRAQVRALAAIIGCDVHPINNRRVLEYLRKQFGADPDEINAWCGNWISGGFDAYEAMLARDVKRSGFSFGGSPTIADVYLIPQVESARRFKVDLTRWPLIMEVDRQCREIEAFQRAAPKAQPDAS